MQQREVGMVYTEMSEVFSDVFETHINPWSSAITFGLRATKESEDNQFTHRIRMPLQQLKALAVTLQKNVREFEERANVDIDLPRDLLDALGIAPEDWQRFKAN